MTELHSEDFSSFFHALHNRDPYPWQERLAAKAVNGQWPGAIDLPTGSGKTTCIDIAIFALACQAHRPVAERQAPRRIFFCVNRRVIVAEAYLRARDIARKIWQAEIDGNDPILRRVAQALRVVGDTLERTDLPPLDALELRGGIRRDNRWARSITQPVVICTTLDQLGSRLLFRGYGVSRNTAPIQAALVAYDSLVLLDEAHISEPFRQTLDYVRGYLDPQRWAEQDIGIRPMQYVPMTATPTEAMREREVIRLEDDDKAQPALRDRLQAPKPTRLEMVTDVAKAAVKETTKRKGDQPLAIGIIVNRIATARDIYNALQAELKKAGVGKSLLPADTRLELVIGSMRPIDRGRQGARLRDLVGPKRPPVTTTPSITVATQCLEVGADYDFDVLITECASLDALRQRFGRLNRAGRQQSGGQYISAEGVILIKKTDTKDEATLKDDQPLDPIYGNAMARTWHWLKQQAKDDQVDFGLDSFEQRLAATTKNGQPPAPLLSPQAFRDAPVMLPAYVDFWCQTAPRPCPDPDAGLFIHGPDGGEPDVQVCWRADLVNDGAMPPDQWCDVVALLPPVAAECVSMPISRLRRWLVSAQEPRNNADSDVLGIATDNPEDTEQYMKNIHCQGVLWRGPDNSVLLGTPRDLKPGDTLVLPATAPDSDQLAHLPDTGDGAMVANDVADEAVGLTRDQAVLRLHPSLPTATPDFKPLLEAAANDQDPPSAREWQVLLKAASSTNGLEDSLSARLTTLAGDLPLRVMRYPDRRGVVLTTRRPLERGKDWFIRAMDEGDDTSSRAQPGCAVTLDDHSAHVRDKATHACTRLPLNGLAEPITLASWLHDWGKADERFQAMLRRMDRTDAWLYQHTSAGLLAKSDGVAATPAERRAARERAGLPQGFRHEMLSVQLAEKSDELPDDPDTRNLVLHLIAAHHGHARPFAPAVVDEELPGVAFQRAELTHAERQQRVPPHRLDSGIAERFWQLVRRYGWWGLAYLEAVLRLADQQASAAEQAGEYTDNGTNQTVTGETGT